EESPVSITEPLKLAMSDVDRVFNYAVKQGDEVQECTTELNELLCPIDQLNLAQGSTHNLEVVRLFENKYVDTIGNTDLSILPAIQVVNSSIATDQLVYEKPKSLTLIFDKTVVAAEPILELVEN